MKRSARFGLSLFVVLANSMPVASVAGQGPAADAAVSKVAADWLAAWNAHDVEAVMALFAEADASMINGGMFITSKDSMRTYITSVMDNVTAFNTTLDRTKVKWLNPTTAFVQATYGGTNSFKDGRTLQWKANAYYSMLLERQDGVWKIVALHNSAGSGTPVPKE